MYRKGHRSNRISPGYGGKKDVMPQQRPPFHSKLNLPVPNGNLSTEWHLKHWEHPRHFPAVRGVYLTVINPDKASDPTVQGAAQRQENIPSARRFPNENMCAADMYTLIHLFYVAKIRTDSLRNSTSIYLTLFFFSSLSSQWHTIDDFRGADSATTEPRRQLKLI